MPCSCCAALCHERDSKAAGTMQGIHTNGNYRMKIKNMLLQCLVGVFALQVSGAFALTLNSQHAIVINDQTGAVMVSKDAESPVPIALGRCRNNPTRIPLDCDSTSPTGDLSGGHPR